MVVAIAVLANVKTPKVIPTPKGSFMLSNLVLLVQEIRDCSYLHDSQGIGRGDFLQELLQMSRDINNDIAVDNFMA